MELNFLKVKFFGIMNFQEKVSELQSEVEKIDARINSSTVNVNVVFGVAVVTPFALATMLYMIGPQFVKTEDEVDRKLIVKWSFVLSLIVWLGLYLYATLQKDKKTIY